MKSLTIGKKIIISNILYVAPFLVLLNFMITTQTKDINFALWEQHGNIYLTPMVNLYHKVSLKRLELSSNVQKPNPNLDKEIDQLWKKAHEVDNTYGVDLQFTEEGLGKRNRSSLKINLVEKRWRDLQDHQNKKDSSDSQIVEMYSGLLKDLAGIVTHAGDTSNLILDPDLDTYYTMDVTLLAIPQTQARLQEVLNFADGVFKRGNISKEDQIQFSVYKALLRQSDLDRIDASTKTALNEDLNFYGQSAAFQKNIPTELKNLTTAIEDFIQKNDAISKKSNISLEDVENFRASGNNCLNILTQSWNNYIKEFQELLQLRITSIEKMRQLYVILSLIALFISAMVSLWIGVNISKRLKSTSQSIDVIAKGNFSQVLATEPNDELGQLGNSVNSMSRDLAKLLKDIEFKNGELAEINSNLENIVNARTQELKAANVTISSMLNSLGQGFFVVGKDGNCLPTFSKACLNLMENNPAGKAIWEVLKEPKEKMIDLMDILFNELIPFESGIEVAPKFYKHSANKKIALEYSAIKDSKNAIEAIIVIATDRTEEFHAKQEAEKERQYVNMIMKILKTKDQFLNFVQESRRIFTNLRNEIGDIQTSGGNLNSIYRSMHTIKGGAGAFSISEVQHLAHSYESQLMELKESKETPNQGLFLKLQSDVDHLENVFDRFLVTNKEVIGANLDSGSRHIEVSVNSLVIFAESLKVKGQTEIYNSFVTTFLGEPVGKFFIHYDNVVSELAERLNKSCYPIKFINEDISVLGDHYADLFSSLIHAFRNCVDHGLEEPEFRIENGKDPKGSIEVKFDKVLKDEKLWLTIEVNDDGRGIDPDKIRAVLLESQPIEAVNRLSDFEIIQHVFDSGLSTAKSVTDISGRGVGTDAIRFAAVSLGGFASMHSIVNKGSSLKIIVPYLTTLVSKQEENEITILAEAGLLKKAG